MNDAVNTCPNQLCTHSPMVHDGDSVHTPCVCGVDGCPCTSDSPNARPHTPVTGRIDD